MRTFISTLAIVVTILWLQSCNSKNSKSNNSNVETIMVYSAASLTDVLTEIVDSFETVYSIKVQTNLASSGTLARQIEQGGNPDVYISASKKWSNYVDSLGYIEKGTKTDIAKNQLVLIAPKESTLEKLQIDSSLNIASILGEERLSIGDPTHVPAGKYAKQVLVYYGWFPLLEKKLLPSKDVRTALLMVEMGETPLGIVYTTDAKKSNKVKILNTFPEVSHKPIVYVSGVCKNTEAAHTFNSYLQSETSKVIWKKYGFY